MSSLQQRGAEMGGRISAFDWAKTPLGPMASWPQSLRTVVNILLSSRYAMWMEWGPDMTFLCNDAYRPTLGLKEGWALGTSAKEVWAEIWPEIGPRIQSVLTTGVATYDEGLLLILERSGFPEETYHTFSYSPLCDDTGSVSGMLCVVTEETERLIGERQVETLRDVAAALASTKTEEEVLSVLCRELGANREDLPFTLIYLLDENGAARLACASGIDHQHPLAPSQLPPGSETPWPAAGMFSGPGPRVVEHLECLADTSALPRGVWDKPVDNAAVVLIRQQGHEAPAGFLVIGINPYRRFDAVYAGFVDLLAGQIAAALGNARAYESERRRAEALAEIDRAKTTFFSNVSHELRTPLTLMLSPVEEMLARKTGPGDSEERNLLDLVHRNGLRLQRLVNTLLDFSRIEAGRMQAHYERVDLPGFTSQLAANFRSAMQKAGLAYKVQCDTPLAEPVYVDREMWEKIVLNLLSNALKYTFRGEVSISVRGTGEFAELCVADTGIGIPQDELPHVFERFHRVAGARGRSIEGTGIGLALVQELVKLHGGSIAVESQESKGSVFKVHLPFGNRHLPNEMPNEIVAEQVDSTALAANIFVGEAGRWLGGAPVAAPAPAATGPRERILLADDNPDMRDYVARLLSGTYQVTPVSTGDEALASALADPPDLIVSDVMMPGLDGFGLLRELRSHPETSTVPVVLVSARAGEESQVEGLGAGADDYLIKPFTARELLARVGAHLSMRRRRQEAEAAVKQSQATLQSFYDSSPLMMGIAELDGDQIVPVYANRSTARFFGIEPDQYAAHNSLSLDVPRAIDELWIEKYEESRRTAKPVHFEYEHIARNGRFWLSSTVNYLGDNQGRPRYSFVSEDITERKKQEAALRRSNDELRRANQDLEQFAYSASHDLQEPLRQVAIYSQLLANEYGGKLDGNAEQYLSFSVEGAQRMQLLVRDLLAYSQAAKTAGPPSELVDANEALEAARQNLKTAIAETGATITTDPLPAVRADRAPLMHVFQNLLSNALKYRSEQTPQVRVWSQSQNGNWCFAVQDNGIGIPKAYHEQIFGIFKRLHDRNAYPGTGIGLAICQKIVERYGGRIWVDSEPGRGTTFFFTLPKSLEDAD